ncbi:MAG TPA: alpha-amylase family glycosyl hydrolase, partial [Acidobacteriota bacterium]
MGNIQTSESYSWWQTGIIYEIYLRSFQDSNEDGIGDLRGIIHRLDYLQWLGVNIIWLTPFYPSPMKDFGYDISDYTAVDPQFGTMHDFDELLDDVHARGMKLIIDFVPNHTSDQHPWFKESRSSKNNPKRDWYIWKDKKENGSPPCNWLSVLGGSAWEWDGHTRQLYYHAFLKEQPDLNFSNEEVISAVADLMRFWLDKGVDGFRIDAMWHLAKDPLLRDNPPNPDYNESMPDCDRLQQIYSCDRPEVQGIVSQLRAVIDEYPDRLMIGEIYLSPEKCVAYYGKRNDGAHLPSNFQLLFLPWEANTIAQAISNYERLLPDQCWPNWAIGNHDRPRLMERIPAEQSRVAAMLLLTLRGTPTLYYADEIGMPQVPIPGDEVRDPQGLLMPDKGLSRDPQRTPMQWDQNENAGFTTVTPWLRLSDDH